jgi:hypothetical protein
VVGDHTAAAREWREAVRHAVDVITRWRLDAALDAPAPPRKARQNGRPRQQGTRRPTLETVLTEATTPWTTVPMAHRYGGRAQRVPRTSETAVWSQAGTPVVPRRGVVRRDPEGPFAPAARRRRCREDSQGG